MRLLRLTTEDTNAVFDTTFNTSIYIKPGSKIALQSFFAKIKNPSFIAYDDTLTYKFDGLATVGIPLRSNVYDRNNYTTLLDDMVVQLTKSWGTGDGADYYFGDTGDNWKLGRQWYAFVEGNKLNIAFKIALATYDHLDLLFASDVDYQKGSLPAIKQDNIKFNDGITDFTEELKFNLLSYYPIASTSGFVRVRVGYLEHNLANNDANAPINREGFSLGLTNKQLTNDGNNALKPEDIVFQIGIGYSQTDADFRIYYKYNGTTYITTEVPEVSSQLLDRDTDNNSFLQLRFNGQNIIFEYTDGLNQIQLLDSITLSDTDIGKQYYPCIILNSDSSGCAITNWEWTFDPVANPTSDYGTVGEYADFHSADYNFMPRPNIFYQFEAELDIPNFMFADFLGFSNYEKTQSNVLQFAPRGYNSVLYQGNALFKASREKLSLLLEFINQNINSYDSEKKSRFNVISTLLSTDANFVVDDVPSIVFLDLLNKDEIDFRNIKIRLLDREFNPVQIEGKATMTLLIKDKDEN